MLILHEQNKGIIYGSVNIPGTQGQKLLRAAIRRLVEIEISINNNDNNITTTTEKAAAAADPILWRLEYTQVGRSQHQQQQLATDDKDDERVISFSPPSLDIAFDDTVIDMVKDVWKKIVCHDDDDKQQEFMVFEDREANMDSVYD